MSGHKIWKILSIIFVPLCLSLLLIKCSEESDTKHLRRINEALKHNNFKLAEELCNKNNQSRSNNFRFNLLYFRTLLQRGRVKKADEFFNKAYRIDSQFTPYLLSNKAMVKYYLGDTDSANIYSRWAIRKTKERAILSRAYNVLGLISFYKGNLDSAEYYQNIAKNFAAADSSMLELANALRQLGVVYWYRGDLNKAKNDFYLPALALYRLCGDKTGEATTLSDIGLIYFDFKNWTKNFEFQLKAMKIRIEIGDLIGLADSYYFFGEFPVTAKELTSLKLKFIEKSDSLSREIGYKWGEEIAANSLLAFYRRNSALIYDRNNPEELGESSSNDAQLSRRISKFYEESLVSPDDSLIEIGKKLIFDSEKSGSEVYKYNAYSANFIILLKSQKYDLAERMIEKIRSASNSFDTQKYVMYKPDILKSSLLIAKKKYNSAYLILKELIDKFDKLYKETIEKSTGILGFESIITQIYSLREYCYSEIYDVLYKMNDNDKFFYYTEMQKQFSSYSTTEIMNGESGSFFNYLKGILENMESKKFNPYADSLISVIQNIEGDILNRSISISKVNRERLNQKFISTANLQKKLKNSEAYLNFSSGTTNGYINLITSNKNNVVRIKGNNSKLVNNLKFLLKTIERGSKYPDDTFWKKPCTQLYDLILRPIDSLLICEQIKTLIISPSDLFFHLPFAILLKEKSKSEQMPLIEKFNIIYCLSATDFIKTSQIDFNVEKSILAIAPNEKLVYTKKEVNEIPSSIFQYGKFLFGKNATTKKFKENAGLYDIIHIAGHSEVSGLNPLNSKIEFYDKALKLIEIYKYKFSPDLVILSSCQSGYVSGIMSDNPGSLDMFSFVRALKDIGAKSVISAGWFINDKSGAQLMISFYRHLSEVKNSPRAISKALRLAQIEMLHSNSNSLFSHPFYWAGYSITQ